MSKEKDGDQGLVGETIHPGRPKETVFYNSN